MDPSEEKLVFRSQEDFNNIDWSGQTTAAEREHAVVLVDDHMDHLIRMAQAQKFGFTQLIYDDNCMPGTGDCFSVKDACDGGSGTAEGGLGTRGRVRAHFSNQAPKRCTDFHSK